MLKGRLESGQTRPMDGVTGPRFMATARPYPRGIGMCARGALALPERSQPPSPGHLPSSPRLPPTFGVLFTQNCTCLVVTVTYCLGRCSSPMHTNILWLLYMNIFNDKEKVVDFLSFFFFFFFWLEL